MNNHVHAQEKPNASSQKTYKDYPLIRLTSTDNLYIICGYYDSSNNVLYDCNGKIILDKPAKLQIKILDSLCCTIKDTDGDGVNDEIDKCINERGPVSNYGCPIIDQSVVNIHYPALRNVFFEAGSSSLSAASIETLKKSVEFLKDWPDLKVDLDGHTDNLGSYNVNRKLSLARIKAVINYLMSSGIDRNRITYNVFVGDKPIADPTTKEGRAMNRRVEFQTYK